MMQNQAEFDLLTESKPSILNLDLKRTPWNVQVNRTPISGLLSKFDIMSHQIRSIDLTNGHLLIFFSGEGVPGRARVLRTSVLFWKLVHFWYLAAWKYYFFVENSVVYAGKATSRSSSSVTG